MTNAGPARAAEFDAHRPRLTALAYRLTGRFADAEDAVQEAWLRLARESAEIRDLGAWLSTVVGRICLDRTRSAAHRRERYVGPWLPEPVVTPLDARDPLEAVVGRDDLRMAALRMLHELPAEQRFAFVLHDGFQVPFAEIAELLGCPAATARQHASRARRALAADAPPRAPLPRQQEVVERFLTAVHAGDLTELTRLLHPEAAFFGDSGGKASTARRPIRGGGKIARFMLGLVTKYGTAALEGVRPVLVNGDLGMFVPGDPTDATGRTSPQRVLVFTVDDDRIAELHDLVNPDKLTRLAL
ncbi:sigma-70 family RNA polymerase sigma factor [Saccharopolyspora gloriosae]|uniref:RNA polymerase sigma-70 factor (ECF subfamily) n=1 Tax=Saccharopolyspora gloriosae TaxID=455344 RepID=A0A840NC74_9PSEU|nr:RNA polymerase sigma factor SigJ [Saccharopolyspora gloriosae]MBB5067953.1 RNA polymerase sigma-70 factor (ECF subfamily) [Saccharopolyspora gloriosae]